MSRQEESIKIVEPLVRYLVHKHGWHVEKTHGSQYMEGFPDLYCIHPKYSPRWVECKVIRNGDFSFTPAQERKFPIWIANGVGIWIACGYDLRNKVELERVYRTLFDPPNCALYLNGESRRTLLR
jgi:hypothetical protein